MGRLCWPASPLVAVGDEAPEACPLRLVGPRLYLDRYWRQERAVAGELVARWGHQVPTLDLELLRGGLQRLFPLGPGEAQGRAEPEASQDPQLAAASAALRFRFTVVAGGPGTGKTTTIARIVALLLEQATAQGELPRIALGAPTGRAAARLEEAIQREAATMDVDPDLADALRRVRASTLHRLLGWRPDSHSRFRYDAGNRLPHETVIVDETSMVSLSLMAKLLAALRPTCRLILVGDPQQLASVEAGAVLGDIVGPLDPDKAPADHARRGIVVLRRVHRFGTEIATLADAISTGDEDRVIELLGGASENASAPIRWIDPGPAEDFDEGVLDPLRTAMVAAAAALGDAAVAGRGSVALELVGAARVLCAHREGPYGVGVWTDRVERVDSGPPFRATGRATCGIQGARPGHPQRLRATALQRGHRRGGPAPRREPDGDLRPPRRGTGGQSQPARGGGNPSRLDGAQGTGFPVRRSDRGLAGCLVVYPHPGIVLTRR